MNSEELKEQFIEQFNETDKSILINYFGPGGEQI
jgi:hypothetical protein